MTSLLTGDVLAVVRSMPPASFDAALSDPPYGTNFLGIGWDLVLPSAEVWRELARVLRPGSNALIFGGPRTSHRLGVALEDAGFTLVDTLMWMYGQGVPKSVGLLKPAYEPIFLARAPGRPVRPLSIGGCRIPGPGGAADGRWPANVLLDEEAAAALDRASGVLRSGAVREGQQAAEAVAYSGRFRARRMRAIASSQGGASRFFYTAKVKGGDRIHPTQKPTALTEWLARLLLVPEGRLLVPYAGVGSEMIGAIHAGWREVVGIEQDGAYVATAERRLARGA